MNNNDNSELNNVKVQEQNQIYFNVPVENTEMEEPVMVQEQQQVYVNVPVNNNENEELLRKVKFQEMN